MTGPVRPGPARLTVGDALELKEIRAACPHLDAAARHVRDLATMPHDRRGDLLPDWMDRVLADDLPALHSLVTGRRLDQDAVTAGLSSSWSSGQVEGQVTRINLIKRQGYGRAGLDLLRKRILLDLRPSSQPVLVSARPSQATEARFGSTGSIACSGSGRSRSHRATVGQWGRCVRRRVAGVPVRSSSTR